MTGPVKALLRLGFRSRCILNRSAVQDATMRLDFGK